MRRRRRHWYADADDASDIYADAADADELLRYFRQRFHALFRHYFILRFFDAADASFRWYVDYFADTPFRRWCRDADISFRFY